MLRFLFKVNYLEKKKLILHPLQHRKRSLTFGGIRHCWQGQINPQGNVDIWKYFNFVRIRLKVAGGETLSVGNWWI